MGIREIKLDNWIKEGHGFTADSYRHSDDETLLLKLFYGQNGPELAQCEYDVATKVEKLGVPTPRVYELVTAADHPGIIYERILDKQSFGRLCSGNPEKNPEYARVFAQYSKALHSRKCDTGFFPNRVDCLKSILDKVDLPDEIKAYMSGLLDALEPADTCLHGDLQTGNLVMGWCEGYEGRTRLPEEENKAYFIDLGTFSYGNPILDVSELYMSCNVYHEEECNTELLHMDTELLQEFWHHFVREYLGTEDEAEIKAYENKVAPYSMFFIMQIIDAADGYQPVIDIAMKHINELYNNR